MLEFMNRKFHDNLKEYSRAPKLIPRRKVFCNKMSQYCYILGKGSKFCNHSSLHCFSTDVYCCACDVQFCDFVMADMKEQHICTEFCFICGKLHPETKPGFTVMTQQKNNSLRSGNACFCTLKKKANQVKHQQDVGNHS